MIDANEMGIDDLRSVLTEYYDYDEDDVEDMEYDDISRRTGLNPVNVRVRISRARQKIKQLMRTL